MSLEKTLYTKENYTVLICKTVFIFGNVGLPFKIVPVGHMMRRQKRLKIMTF